MSEVSTGEIVTMTIQQANELPIVDVLAREGFMPHRQAGRNWWYISPIRVPEKTASFKVDTTINKWYDHGIGKGGGTLDLFLLLHRIDSISEALDRLSRHSDSTRQGVHANHTFPARLNTENKLPDRRIVITNVAPLSTNISLVSYLRSRAIPLTVADPYCKAVDYELVVGDEMSDKKYFAVGFQNRSGGYELSNPIFKSSSSPKDVTHFKTGAVTLSLFEGFIDFLSALVAKEILPVNGDQLILNSINLLEKNLPLISRYGEITCFLDNDAAGKQALSKLQAAGLKLVDASSLYAGNKDVNEWLQRSSRRDTPKKYVRRSPRN